MKIITSSDNLLIRHILSLNKDNAYRLDRQQVVIEGIHLVQSLFKFKRDCIVSLVYSQDKRTHKEVRELIDGFEGELIEVPHQLFKKISTLNAPDGVLAVMTMLHAESTIVPNGFHLALDTIQDPGNVGTLLRSAAASGFNTVLLSKGCAHAWSPKVLRAGMGAHFELTIFEQVDLEKELYNPLQTVWVATLSECSQPYYGINLAEPFTLIVGNEGAGVDSKLQLCYPNHLKVPMQGSTESLNAAVAGSIIMFESLRQRQ
ncbi:RNA methyltransferase [Ferrovum sp. PN-J185]|uniref:TrmH family RNA methyltransferase n=1 Tax=Ferrovum sp. PN-J185 TaxID=1356306 RepID=UPI000799E95E|nr:RNA methyltransferase [Ferrovum sp. PN-J185]KXW56318.1 23S rRNA (uridine(2479)-2'-O)-methyltransferase [Ferrovum sp. PN-J185]MCC6069042.1 RNA methyltransferase [Ferrovum sp. PN-J185]MDE1890978.1 RNA methyltransferase [Betaproteobacteria bacterium]MDE2055710.1 RNA methyltransferase [Betaproteobacteria bacterium]